LIEIDAFQENVEFPENVGNSVECASRVFEQ